MTADLAWSKEGGDAWASIVLSTDPMQYQWARPTRRKYRLIMEALRPVVERVTRDSAVRRAMNAVAALEEDAMAFLRHRPKYEAGILEAFLDDVSFQKHYSEFIVAAGEAKGQRPAKGERIPNRVVTGPELDTLLKRINALEEEVRANRQHVVDMTVATPPERRRNNLYWFVYDPILAPEFSDAILGKLESEAGYTLMNAAANWSQADLCELANARYRGLLRFARFRAGIPGSTFTLVPSDERLDVPAIIARTRQARENLGRQLPRILSEITGR